MCLHVSVCWRADAAQRPRTPSASMFCAKTFSLGALPQHQGWHGADSRLITNEDTLFCSACPCLCLCSVSCKKNDLHVDIHYSFCALICFHFAFNIFLTAPLKVDWNGTHHKYLTVMKVRDIHCKKHISKHALSCFYGHWGVLLLSLSQVKPQARFEHFCSHT